MRKNGNDGGDHANENGTAAAAGHAAVEFRACLMEETCLGRGPPSELPEP